MKTKSLKELMRYAGKYKYFTYASWIISAISAWIALIPFIYIWKIIKEILEVAPNYSFATNLSHYGWMAVLFAIISVFLYLCGLLCSHLSAFRVQANMRSKMLHHIITLPNGFMDSVGTGKLRKTVDECSASTETYLAHQLPDKAGAIATPIGLLVLLFAFDWRLGLLSLIPVASGFIVMSAMTGKKMALKMKEYQNSLDNMSNEAVEYVRGIPVVKTFGQSFFSFKRFKKAIDDYQKWVISYTKDLRKPMVVYTTMINAVFAVLIAAGLFFTRNGVTNEFLLNLMFYIIITPIITVTLNKIMYSSENSMIVKDALERINSVMNMKPLPEKNTSLLPQDNSISLKDVCFAYDGAKSNAIETVSLEIKTGEHVAFVGPSGSGKTTLASLIARFWDVNQGEISIGGVNVKDISKGELMNEVSFVFQDSKLLKMSILDNVRLANKNASLEDVIEALHNAQCDDIIEKLPEGVNTVIGSKGVYLSGGEQQRIAIARVILKNSPIVILDEATAFADPDNEIKVQKALTKLSANKTVIMIAHRLSTVMNCDQIFVLENGKIIEKGTHCKLIEASGRYSHMWTEYNKTAKWKVGK